MTKAELTATLLATLSMIEHHAQAARLHACNASRFHADSQHAATTLALPGPGPKPPTQTQLMQMAQRAGAMSNESMVDVCEHALELGKILGILPPPVLRAYGMAGDEIDVAIAVEPGEAPTRAAADQFIDQAMRTNNLGAEIAGKLASGPVRVVLTFHPSDQAPPAPPGAEPKPKTSPGGLILAE